MSEINSARHETKLVNHNLKNNIQVNAKTQAVQNINFQEILTGVNGPTQSHNINQSQNNISLDSLHSQTIGNDENNNSDNKPKIQDKSTTSVKTLLIQDTNTTLFSEYIPQKIVEIDDKNMSKLTREHKSEHHQKKSSTKKIIKVIKPEHKQSSHKLIKTNSFMKSQESNHDDLRLISDKNNISSTTITAKKAQEINLPTPNPENRNFEDEENKKKKHYYDFEEDDKEQLNNEVEDIIENYGLPKPEFSLSRIDGDNPDHSLWLRNLIFGASNEPLTYKESESISKYITDTNKITEKEKKILCKLLEDIFQHQIIKLNSDFLSRLDKDSFEMVYKIFPDFILDGFLKKTSLKLDRTDKKKNTEILYKIVNGIKISENDSKEFIYDFEINIEDEYKGTLIHILQGYYEKDKPNQIYKVLEFLKNNEYIVPGFTGYLQKIFIELSENNHHESAKKVLRFMEAYSRDEILLLTEAKLIASLFIKNYFNTKTINVNSSADILAKLIVGERVDYLSLDLISKLSRQNILSFLPPTIDKDMKYYLQSMPFYENEVDTYKIDNIETTNQKNFSFNLCGKICLKGIEGQSAKINLHFYQPTSDLTFSFSVNHNHFFEHQFSAGTYRLKNISLNIDNQIISLNTKDKYNFSVNELIDIFYLGTIKVFINPKDFCLKKLELKNDYKSFINHKNIKDKIIKINPELYKKSFK